MIRRSSVKADELRKLVTSEQVGAQVNVLAEPAGWQACVNAKRRRFTESTRGQSPRLTSAREHKPPAGTDKTSRATGREGEADVMLKVLMMLHAGEPGGALG